MAMLKELIEQTLGEINTYVRNQESVTVITSLATAGDLTMSVDDTTALSRGIVEIEDELIYIKKVFPTTGTVQALGSTANPIGRGWRGTSAAQHVSGSIVRNNPTFPRTQVKRAILETIKGMDFPCIANYTFTFTGADYSYIMPDTLKSIVGISWDVPDSTGVWQMIKRYRIDKNYYDADTASIKTALILNESPMPGRTVNVQYVKPPIVITESQELTVSGLPVSCEDVVRLGAMYRLLSTVDPGKVIAYSVSADVMDQPVQTGASTAITKYIFNLYTVRLAEEISKQQARFLNTIQYTR